MMNLTGKTIVVIGGSSGIGLAAAKLAYSQGAMVTITGTTEAKAKRVAESVGKVGYAKCDAANEADVNALFNRFERIDHVLMSAGSTKLGSIYDGEATEHLAPIYLRIAGGIYAVRAAGKKINAGGSFTFAGGLSTDRPVQGAWVSGMATAAAEQLARVLALDLAPTRFNAVAPGYTDTPMWDAVLGENKKPYAASVAERLLVKKIASAEEVAEAVIFLMRNESVTGEVIHIDGGARLI